MTTETKPTNEQAAQKPQETIAAGLTDTKPAQPEWDKQRQQADEVKALNRKVQEQTAENKDLRTQLEQLQAAQDAGEAVDLDTFEGLKAGFTRSQKDLQETRASLQKATDLLEKQNERIANLEGNVHEVSQTANSQAGLAFLDKTCKPLDAKYGGQHRNEALEIVDAKFKKFGIDKLGAKERREWVQEELAATYERLAGRGSARSGTDTEVNPLVTDTGSGGSATRGRSTLKEGTLDEVCEQMLTQKG